MAQLSGLRVAIALAERRRDAAAAELARVRAGARAAQGQLDQLQGYAGETEGRWTQQAQVLATPELLQHHYQFMTRLYQALEMQRGVMQQHERHVELHITRLREAELRLGSLQKVVARKLLDAQRQTLRREQKDVDEFAALQSRRNAAHAWEGQT